MTTRFMGRGIKYIQLVKALYCVLLTIGKKLPAFPHGMGLNCTPQRWKASVLPLHHLASSEGFEDQKNHCSESYCKIYPLF